MTKLFSYAAFLLLLIWLCPSLSFAQSKPKDVTVELPVFRSSPAYAELLLRRTELQSELESLVLEYTDDYPRVKEIKFVMALIERDTARLGKVKASESSKLTLALGKLILRRIELETDLWKLRRSYQEEHPDVKQAKRKVEIFENAIAEILN